MKYSVVGVVPFNVFCRCFAQRFCRLLPCSEKNVEVAAFQRRKTLQTSDEIVVLAFLKSFYSGKEKCVIHNLSKCVKVAKNCAHHDMNTLFETFHGTVPKSTFEHSSSREKLNTRIHP